ncbi:MAG: hypothetical protein WBG86_07935 [Polyangiales bacterium]
MKDRVQAAAEAELVSKHGSNLAITRPRKRTANPVSPEVGNHWIAVPQQAQQAGTG